VALACGCFAGPGIAETPEELFDRGNRLYEEGRFEEAAAAYAGAARYGIEDYRLEYNLGNAAYRSGRLGEAILHYERAYRLRPTDPDIVANLELARSLRADRVERPSTAGWLRWARGVQNRLGPDRQALIALVLLWAAAALATWAWGRPAGWNAATGWIVATLVVALAATTASWGMTRAALDGSDLAVILDESVPVLAGPGEGHASLVTVHEGLDVRVRGERGPWVQVRLPNGVNGWVPGEALGRLE
jgi:hypothetical protein